VTFGLDKDVKVDLDSVQIEMPTSDYGGGATAAGTGGAEGPGQPTRKTPPARRYAMR
jgi:hypothetical protein